MASSRASALNLYFANAIARELAKSHPGRYLLTFYAFWGTHDGPFPPMKAEPGVCVTQLNEGNHTQPWDRPERPDISQIIDRNNRRERIAFDDWKKTGAIMSVREWWIPACDHPQWQRAPWYSGETALRNLRYWFSHGVRHVSYQTGMEKGTGFPLRWPLYYTGARGLWDPEVTSRKIMQEACAKLYGPASAAMCNYYATIEQAMADSDLLAKSWRLPSPELIYTPEIEKKATGYLDSARAIPVDGAAGERIRQERALWDDACALLAKLRAKPEGAQPSKANPGM